MENLPYDDPERLSSLVKQIYSSSHEEVRKAQSVISYMSEQDICRFIKSMIGLINQDKINEATKILKSQASTSMGQAILSVFKDYRIKRDELNYIVSEIFNAIFSSNIDHPTKVNLQYLLLVLISIDACTIPPMLALIDAQIQNLTFENCIGVFLVVEVYMMNTFTPFQDKFMWFTKIQERLLKISQHLITEIIKVIDETKETQNLNERSSEIASTFKMLKLAILCFESRFKELTNQGSRRAAQDPALLNLIATPNTLQLLVASLDLQLNTEKQLPNYFISTSGLESIDQIVNDIKAKVIRCFTYVLQSLAEAKGQEYCNQNLFFRYATTTGAVRILSTLFSVCENSSFDLNTALTDRNLNACLTECLILAAHLVAVKEKNDMFFDYFKRLVMNVCLVFLKTDDKELRNFKENPEEFVRDTLDICQKQESKTVKSQAAKLLEAICDYVQGATTFTVKVIMTIMDYLSVSNNPEDIPTKYPLLKEYQEGPFLKNSNTIAQLETCILSLVPISDLTYKKRDDLVQLITRFLDNFKAYFQSEKLDPLVRSRLCTFISFYYEIIPENLYPFMVEFLLDSLSICNPDYIAVSLSALETIDSILESCENRARITPYIDQITLKIAAEVKTLPYTKLISIIRTLFEEYTSQLTNNPELIKVLFEALVDQLVLLYTGDGVALSRHTANSIWGIISMVSNDERYIPTYQEGIEEIMKPLFNMFLNNEQVPFREDLLSYVTSVTKLSKSISPACWNLAQVFPKILLRTKDTLGPLLPALNQIIAINGTSTYEDPSFTKTLVELGIQGVALDYENEVAIYEFALLLELILQHLNIAEDDWRRILEACFDRFRETEDPKIRVRLGGVVLSACISNFDLTWRIIESCSMESDLMRLFLENSLDFAHKYERKLLIIGLSIILSQGLGYQSVTEKLSEILGIIICFLEGTVHVEQKKLEKIEVGFINRDDDDDDHNNENDNHDFRRFIKKNLFEMECSNSDDDDDCEIDEDEQIKCKLEEIMDGLDSVIKKKDEFAIFQEVIRSILESHRELLKEALKLLGANKQNYLKEVLRTKRIVIDTDRNTQEPKTELRRLAKARGIKKKSIIEE